MIQFMFNKEVCKIDEEKSIFEYLTEKGVLDKWVAIIVDLEPISVDESKQVIIKDKMKIDIVRFVGGG